MLLPLEVLECELLGVSAFGFGVGGLSAVYQQISNEGERERERERKRKEFQL